MKKMIVLLTVLLLVVSGSALAQVPVPCGGLSDADCAVFTAATEAMMQLESASVDMNLDVTVANIPDAPFDLLAFNLSGQGAYHVEPGLMEKYASLQSDPAALLQNMNQLGTMMSDLFNGFDGQVSLALTLPDELVAMATQGETSIPNTLSVELRLVDGVGYVNLSSLAETLPQEAGIPAGWYGLEIARLMENMMNLAAAQMEDMEVFGMDASAMSMFTDPEFINSYMQLERLPDSDGAAIFQMTLNMAALAENEAFRDLMQQQMEASGQTLSEADLEQVMDMVAQMYEGMDMQATYAINLDDNNIRSMDMTMNWDLASMMAAVGESSEAAPTINVTFNTTYSDYNAAPAVTAPEGAVVMTAENVMQMFMGSSSGAMPPVETLPTVTPSS